MTSPADPGTAAHRRARVLLQLRDRLEGASRLALEMRRGLASGDLDAIHGATSRLETLALEYKLLAREYGDLPEAPDPQDAELVSARRALEDTATRLARSSAVAGGLLERMVAMGRGLVAMLGQDGGDSYTPSGRSVDYSPRGLRLTERA